MTPAGTSPDGILVEVVEIPDHPWFVAVQYHPEFRSQPNNPHPLFAGFLSTALKVHQHRPRHLV
jgi:CTP synthase